MANYDAGLASGYVLRLSVSEDSLNAGANTSRAVGSLSILKGSGSGRYSYDTCYWSINLGGNTASGSIGGFDFRGYSSLLLWSGAFTITHDADGSKSISVAGAFSESVAELGNASAGGTFGLTTLRVTPGTPTSVVGSRVSDTSLGIVWVNNFASNGAPSTNNIQQSVNGGAFVSAGSIAATTSVSVASAANRKTVFQINAQNSTGTSAWSASSNAVYTTPAAPTVVSAAKSGANIVVTWTDNVAFAEHAHKVEAASSADGGATWSAWSALTSAGAGGTYTDTAPDAAKLWKYQVSALNTDVGALQSAPVASNTVQLLAPPNAPSWGAVPAYADKAASLVVPWSHNPVDTTAQKYYEFGYSTNGGSTWSSTGKVTSATSAYTIAANTYAANAAVTIRVRTWGDASTGGSDGAGGSPWSATKLMTFKTRPVVTITNPANASTYTQATLVVALGFSQAEAATFVQATIGLYSGATLLESIDSTTLAGTTFATRVADGGSYSVKATAIDSNGLVTAQVTSSFSVAYTVPVTAGVTVTYLRDSGWAQLDLSIASPGGGEAAAVTVSVARTIDGVTESVADGYTVASTMTFVDTSPTIMGANVYTVTTFSADGATAVATVTLTTAEPYYAFFSTGPGFADWVMFYGNLTFSAAPSRSKALVPTSGRARPIALFGRSGGLVVSGSADLFPDGGSTPQDVEDFILNAGLVCYRDPSGRRIFGTVEGSVDSPSSQLSPFSFTVTEAE